MENINFDSRGKHDALIIPRTVLNNYIFALGILDKHQRLLRD